MEEVISKSDTILVTGANGFVGARVVDILLEYGYRNLRCFVRHSSQLDKLRLVLKKHSAESDVQFAKGDLLSPPDCAKALESVQVVYHLAAGIEKSFAGAFMNSAIATRNLMDSFLAVKGRRFVNVSSFAVYSTTSLERGALLDETCALETESQKRFDAYGFGKLKQDQLVMKYGAEKGLPYVIVRPGSIFGPGKKGITGRVGIDTFGFFMHLGGSNRIPLTFVDNCAEAIVLAGLRPGIDGEVFNILDDEEVTSREFLNVYRRFHGFRSVRIPYFLAYVASALWERYSERSKGQLPPVFNRRRCKAEWGGHRYSNKKARVRLNWTPRVSMRDALEQYALQFQPEGK